jgi:hypothetical protein
MTDLVPIRVTLYKRTANLDAQRRVGQADYPPWNELSEDLRRGLPGSIFIDVHGSGFISHDRVENLGLGNDFGRVMALVPEDFAEAAHARWPHLVEILDETEAADFYDTRYAHDQEDHVYDDAVIDRIHKLAALEQAGVKAAPSTEEQAARADALDPSTESRGVRVNDRKTFARLKAKSGWGSKIKASITKRGKQPTPPGWIAGRGK